MSSEEPIGQFGFDADGKPMSQADAQQMFMLGMYDLRCEGHDAAFSPDLLARFEELRLAFMDEFESRFPVGGKDALFGARFVKYIIAF